MSKKTAILGASPNPSKYAYMAAHQLKSNEHEIVPIGIRKGEVAEAEILDLKSKPEVKDIDTVTLYIGPNNQPEWEDYILSLKPKRIIFNPGTENGSLQSKAKENGIETLHACTLVMLSTGQY